MSQLLLRDITQALNRSSIFLAAVSSSLQLSQKLIILFFFAIQIMISISISTVVSSLSPFYSSHTHLCVYIEIGIGDK